MAPLRDTLSMESIETFAKAVAVQCLLGLQLVHAKQALHRDVKPENILLSDNGRVKWCDFETITDTENHPSTVTGTESYLAPEVIKNVNGSVRNLYTSKIDIWALGLTLYSILCGGLPAELSGLRYAVVLCNNPTENEQECIDRLFVMPKEVSVPFRDFVRSMITVNPQNRRDAFSLALDESLSSLYTNNDSLTSPKQVGDAAKSLTSLLKTHVNFDKVADAEEELRSICRLSLAEQPEVLFHYKNVVAYRQRAAIKTVQDFLKTLTKSVK
mmetsp:Transcript_30995/g.35843  ORF Transcript_30995/g.35843 Transcript_30995/m.35843 type:complete len:271 (+) Transcript_30995:2-814(+)